MLQLILGKSGCGKTEFIHNQIVNRVTDTNARVYVLVPDQSTLDTEKALLDLLGAKKSAEVGVYGFSGMCRYVFEEFAFSPENVIDDGTRGVLMNLALEQLTEKLTLFGGLRKTNVADMMISVLRNCKQHNITTDMLRGAAESIEDQTLKTKLEETALILDTYDALLSQSYIDPLDDLARLYDILDDNREIFKNSVFYIDSFSGFNAQQLSIIKLLISRCAYIGVALCLDPLSDKSEDVFAICDETRRTLINMARGEGVDIKAPVKLTEQMRFKNDELSRLEEGIFRKHFSSEEAVPEYIRLYEAEDQYDESERAAREIKKLIINNNYSYSDFIVICRDTAMYEGILNVVLEKYDIPFFMDTHKSVAVKPAVRLADSVFRLLTDSFEREDFMSLLKSGLTVNSAEDISEFENYVFVWNINNSAFLSEFTQNPSGFSDEFSESDRKRLLAAEKVRCSITEPLLRFKERTKDNTCREISEAFYNLLEELRVPKAQETMYEELERTGNADLGAEQIRVWGMLMTALDKTVAAAGDIKMPLRRYYELLSIQIKALEFSDIPQFIDSITVTTAQRVRLPAAKVVFLIGCAEEVFPAVPRQTGLFSPFELKLLRLNDMTLSDDISYLSNLELFLAYTAVTSASERLYVSYSLSDLGGNSYSPSAIMTDIQKLFPNIILKDKTDFNVTKESMLAYQPAFEEYSRLRGNGTDLVELRELFEGDIRYRSKLIALDRALDGTPFRIEDSGNAALLFGDNLTISASQIEKFSLCRFAYFCNYGLRIRERRRAEIDPMEYGTLVHYILEVFFSLYGKSEFSVMQDDELKIFIRDTIERYLEGYFGGSNTKTKAFLFKLDMLSDNVFVLLKHTITELSQSDFEVADCELNIGKDIPSYTIVLPTGHKIAVCGSVDRVDLLKKDGVTFIRVVDYKTGSKKFKLSDILYGLNLQMLMYLYSINVNGKERYGDNMPAGILYAPATVPVISADGMTDDMVYSEINKSLAMNGLLLKDAELIRGMDKSERGTYIPVSIKAGKTVSKRSLATLEQFGKIFKKLELTVADMGKSIYGGHIEAEPVKGAHDACEYCPYDSVCFYRRSEPKYTFDVPNDEVYEFIDKETGGEL